MLGHELTHIRNGDVRMLVIAVIIAGVIAFFAELVFRLLFQGGLRWRGGARRRPQGRAESPSSSRSRSIAVAWMLSIVIRFALSRRREYLADAGSVELTKNPDAMISALRKIEGRGELPGATSAVMEMCIDNPREGFSNIFDTHPPVDARVAALVKFAGGHDPGPLALPAPASRTQPRVGTCRSTRSRRTLGDDAAGAGGAKPFLPSRPPIELGGSASPDSDARPVGTAPEIAGESVRFRSSHSRHVQIRTSELRATRNSMVLVPLLNPKFAIAFAARCARTSGSGTGSPRLGRPPSMPLEGDQRAHRHVELAQLVGAAEIRQIDDEAGGEHLARRAGAAA